MIAVIQQYINNCNINDRTEYANNFRDTISNINK